MTAVLERGLALRPYQEEMITATEAAWAAGITPVAGVAATGLGKTIFFSALAERWITDLRWDDSRRVQGGRVLVLVHRDELVQQAVAKLRVMAPHVSVGIVKASVDETDRDVVVASVQTLRSPVRMERLTDVGMVIVDECHHSSADSYQSILRHYGCYVADPAMRTPCIGVTATLERSDGRGMGSVFADIAFERDILFGVKNGFLADVRGLTVVSEGLDLSRVKRSRGDYNEGELGEVMGDSLVCRAIADAYDEHARDDHGQLRRGVHFAPTVDSAYAQADAYNRADIRCEVVTGETPIPERAGMYHRFRTGETSILANCMVLTEGWDAPHAEVAVMGRPTQSASLYQQCVGRILRPYPGKRLWDPATGRHNGGTPALVLDVVGAAKMHKLASLVDMSTYTPKEGETLAEAEIREVLGALTTERTVRGPKWQRDGELTEIDLFAESKTDWKQTTAGVWFISAGVRTLFLWEFGPDESGQDVYGIASYLVRSNDRPTLHHRGLPFSLAMSLAEQMASEADEAGTFAGRNARWKRDRTSPITLAQRGHWALAGVNVDGMTKVEASRRIDITVASQRIDRWLRRPVAR